MSRVGRRALCLALLTIAACGTERPGLDEWTVTWQDARDIVPTADEVAEGGQPLCDELVTEMRQTLTQLDPTPADALDDVVDTWVKAAESMAFDCPTGDDLERRVAELDSLAAEVDAGIAAARTS